MLKAIKIGKAFGGHQALNDCTLHVAPHSVTGIIGPNGAGKSTLFNILGGALRPDAGQVLFDGRDIAGLRPDQRARQGLVRTFQISRELGALTVLENMLLAAPGQLGESVFSWFMGRTRVRAQEAAAKAKARALLEHVNLWMLANEPACNLSGGQKKLLEIARALMLEPKLLLLDEPTAGVSPALSRTLCDTILGLKARGITVAVIEHDMEMVASICSPVFVLAEGRTLAEGTYEEVASKDEVMHAYLGGAAA
jgi:ABC-type branched-subunit amino acid transport system ATPase component